MNRGAVHWAQREKRRPILIVSPLRRNELAHDVLAIPFSTTRSQGSWHVQFQRGEAGLPRACVAKCEQINVVPKDEIDPQPIGQLSEARMRDIEHALMSACGIESP